MMGSKDRDGLKPRCWQVFPQTAVGVWVMALGAECGETVAGSLLVITARGAMKQAGAQHRLGECMSSVKHQKHEKG